MVTRGVFIFTDHPGRRHAMLCFRGTRHKENP
jgi:hypothetical protein